MRYLQYLGLSDKLGQPWAFSLTYTTNLSPLEWRGYHRYEGAGEDGKEGKGPHLCLSGSDLVSDSRTRRRDELFPSNEILRHVLL